MPQTRWWKASASSSVRENLTHVVRSRKRGSPSSAGRDAPGSTTGMIRYPPRLPLTRFSIAARSSSCCQGLKPPGPMKTAQAALIDQRLLEGLLPGVARDQLPLVEEGLDPVPLQPPGQLLDGWLVRAAMREEDIVVARRGADHERHPLTKGVRRYPHQRA